MTMLPQPAGDAIVQERRPQSYTAAEQQFSQFVEEKMRRLLSGDDDRLVLMRRYYERTGCETAFLMPARIDKAGVRPDVAEDIVCGVLQFLNADSPGGPVSQFEEGGILREAQTFPTQYPHIVVERVDEYDRRSGRCILIEWKAVRLQNQRRSTAINRALDVGNLAIEITRLVR